MPSSFAMLPTLTTWMFRNMSICMPYNVKTDTININSINLPLLLVKFQISVENRLWILNFTGLQYLMGTNGNKNSFIDVFLYNRKDQKNWFRDVAGCCRFSQHSSQTALSYSVPFHSQCVKMVENMDLLMSQLLPFWPCPPQKFKSKDLQLSKKSYPS